MNLSLSAWALWAAGFVGHAALFVVLVVRKRIATVPWFTAWVAFNIVYTVTLYAAYRLGTKHIYAMLYWGGAFLDLAFQVTVVLEIAGYVFRRGTAWVGNAKRTLLVAGIASVLIAAGMGWWMAPLATSRIDGLESRVDLGATVLITCLFGSVMVLSERFGVSWRSLILREGYGVAIWSVVSFFTDTLHAYWRTAEHFTVLEQVRMYVYLSALVYWIIVFWLPDRTPFVPDAASRRSIESLSGELH